MAWLECQALAELPWLVHAFSTREGGVSHAPCAGLNLSFTESDQRERVEENRRRFRAETGTKDFKWATVRQVHSSHSFVVSRAGTGELRYEPAGGALSTPADPLAPAATRGPAAEAAVAAPPMPTLAPAGDAVMTREPGVLLSVRIADCLPVLLVDPERRAIAAVHAGWRGALARILEKAVGDLRQAFGSDPGQVIAALGPSIRACCYDVGEEVVEAFHGRFGDAGRSFHTLPRPVGAGSHNSKIPFLSPHPPEHAPEHVPAARLDLVAVAEVQLVNAGVKPSNILVADFCTACRTDLFFSHRKEGARTGRQMAAIGIVSLNH